MVFDKYLLKSLGVTTLLTALALTAIIMLTQSLRLLELIINSGASGLSFFVLSLLAVPRFLEIILPIALIIGIVFIYNRMSSDSEIVVLRGAGLSAARLARPALMIAGMVTMFLFVITCWLAPVSLASMQVMRTTIKSEFSGLLLRDGIFNTLGKTLTVYVGKRGDDGSMENLMIYSNPPLQQPVTILAKRGVIVTDDNGQQVLVYDGSRQEYNEKTGALNRLDFQQYSIDLPESGPVRQRWREPDERTLYELLFFDKSNPLDMQKRYDFLVEAHRRVISPFLAVTFTVLPLCCLLLGATNRRGLGRRILMASVAVTMIQGLYLVIYNVAKENVAGIYLMYVLVFVPLVLCGYLLMPQSDALRYRLAQKWNKGWKKDLMGAAA